MNKNLEENLKRVVTGYPELAKEKFFQIKNLIYEVADKKGISKIEESLKWNEPSFSVKGGTPVRIAWNLKRKNQIGVYFSCSTNLIENFRVVYEVILNFEGKRGIIFQLNDEIPVEELKMCLEKALTYHKVKNLPLLGM